MRFYKADANNIYQNINNITMDQDIKRMVVSEDLSFFFIMCYTSDIRMFIKVNGIYLESFTTTTPFNQVNQMAGNRDFTGKFMLAASDGVNLINIYFLNTSNQL